VDDTLRLDCLALAQGRRFQKDRVVAGAAQAVETPQSSSAASEHEHI